MIEKVICVCFEYLVIYHSSKQEYALSVFAEKEFLDFLGRNFYDKNTC